MDDTRNTIIDAQTVRDFGKRFRIAEVDPLTFSGFVLRLVSALKVESYEALLDELKASESAPIDLIMRVLSGCDPQAVHALVGEVLQYVEIAADPKHPEAFRPIMKTDIRDLPTLGQILMAFGRLNFAGAF